MPRIDRAHPPVATRMIDSAGRIACRTRSRTKGTVKAGKAPALYPPNIGSTGNRNAKR